MISRNERRIKPRRLQKYRRIPSDSTIALFGILFTAAYSGYATELLVGMTTRLQETCAENGIEYAAVHSATLKKFATGSGRADKVTMMKRAAERFPGRKIEDDNESDALLLLEYAKAKFGTGKN